MAGDIGLKLARQSLDILGQGDGQWRQQSQEFKEGFVLGLAHA
jgi:hypothetical protein